MQFTKDLIAPLAIAVATTVSAPKVLRVLAHVVDEYPSLTAQQRAILVRGIGDSVALALEDGMGVTSKEVGDNIRIIGGAGELSESGTLIALKRDFA